MSAHPSNLSVANGWEKHALTPTKMVWLNDPDEQIGSIGKLCPMIIVILFMLTFFIPALAVLLD